MEDRASTRTPLPEVKHLEEGEVQSLTKPVADDTEQAVVRGEASKAAKPRGALPRKDKLELAS